MAGHLASVAAAGQIVTSRSFYEVISSLSAEHRALLRGLDERLREETGMPIHLADNPLDSVVLGTGKCVEDFDTLRQVLVPESRR